MPRLLLLPRVDARAQPIASAISAYRHTITLGIIFAAHLILVGLVDGRAALFGPMLLADSGRIPPSRCIISASSP